MTANENRDYDISREALGLPEDGKTSDKKTVEQIAQGKAAPQSKTGWRHFVGLLFGGDPKEVCLAVGRDVAVPALQNFLFDSGIETLERLIFGETRTEHRRNSTRRDYVGYSKRSGSRSAVGAREETRRTRAVHHFKDVILETRDEADSVLSRMYDIIQTYKMITVAELYGLVGITAEYTDESWGWKDLRSASIRRVREGYLIDLPQPREL